MGDAPLQDLFYSSNQKYIRMWTRYGEYALKRKGLVFNNSELEIQIFILHCKLNTVASPSLPVLDIVA